MIIPRYDPGYAGQLKEFVADIDTNESSNILKYHFRS